MRRLHGQSHAHAECGESDHRCRAHSDKHHLPEDRREFEELAFERRDEYPIQQTRVELEIVFHNGAAAGLANAKNDKTGEMTKAESSASLRNKSSGEPQPDL